MGDFQKLVFGRQTRAFEDGAAAYQRGDYAEALKCFRLAADKGVAVAQLNLGLMFAAGHGVARDYAEALKWFRLAAARENADAQYAIGVAYSNGYGVSPDDAEAQKWYGLAAAQRKLSTRHKPAIMGPAMNTRQRRILIAVAVMIAGMMLYPPFYYPRDPGRSEPVSHGYDWLLGHGAGRIEVELLLVQFLVVGVIGAIAYVLCADKKQ